MDVVDRQQSKFLELPSDLICEDLELLKQSLLSALASAQPALISGRLVTRIGTAALQLLVAYRRECVAQGLQFEIRDASHYLLTSIACAGLEGELRASLAAQ